MNSSTEGQRSHTGYYGGAGARLMRTLGPLQGTAEADAPGRRRAISLESNWKVGVQVRRFPSDWLSGVYLGKLSTLPDGEPDSSSIWTCGSESYFIFIVRDNRRDGPAVPGVGHDVALVQPLAAVAIALRPRHGAVGRENNAERRIRRQLQPAVGTLLWNGFPASFYALTNGSGEFLMTESPARVLARAGRLRRDVHLQCRYARRRERAPARQGPSCRSATTRYWTDRMFENVTKARDAGVSLAFLSGNSVSGVVELLPGSDGRPNRVMRRAGRGFQGEQELMGSTAVQRLGSPI